MQGFFDYLSDYRVVKRCASCLQMFSVHLALICHLRKTCVSLRDTIRRKAPWFLLWFLKLIFFPTFIMYTQRRSQLKEYEVTACDAIQYEKHLIAFKKNVQLKHGGSTFLRNVTKFIPHVVASHPARLYSGQSPWREPKISHAVNCFYALSAYVLSNSTARNKFADTCR